MISHDRWEERYREGDLPWDTGRPDAHLVKLVTESPMQPCRAIELGCGKGANAVWLAEQGYSVTAVDISETAVEHGRLKAEEAGVEARFVAGSALELPPDLGEFGFAFDRGCFHSFETPEERARFAENVSGLLVPDGLWYSLMGSKDSPPRETGPPTLSVREIAEAVEPRFEFISLVATRFDSDSEVPPRGWACLLKKRTPGLE